ncbi:MAG: anhydro-N-acetylmuramic acid kinase [Gammaproteobacteria bacterium]|nr:anhydro-N-acetylmuramic acid kinase [Gammaproteobacteria bacterium]NIR83265.1 anhydro-N-acetylmuramic acid kinase [Gammaproteobacteria bacterium]NIR91065.1 anhydro-N-acetylmuramic acid kinase [Gammaproteobacteria bacterium]NIU04432.1 anhydro-N-acetylmuramic acid kinase [Gammaproteobacteria bacterium]NIW87068.1 anhydro-N-acetylmuramic acid kinase [Gammaproteobacteria bacterium]
MALYVGLMSGTSMDAVDAALLEFEEGSFTLVAAHSEPIRPDVRAALLEVARGRGDHLDRVSELDAVVGALFAEAVDALLREQALSPSRIRAIGSHGQTVRHRPGGPTPTSVQIGDPNVIAERTGITTVADFRRRDMAAGGQGAPLAPAFHRAALHDPCTHRAVLNIGGIANVTVLASDPAAPVSGFDTGPGNVLLDAWASEHLGTPMDTDGRWASGGRVHDGLLAAMMRDPYFAQAPPKSTGRERFNLRWITDMLDALAPGPSPQDIQRTLCALTELSVAQAIERFAPATEEVLVCGGGAHNPVLMAGLAARLGGRRVVSTAAVGLDPGWVEAAAFAWLAHQTLSGRAGNLPDVTGARHAVVLGGIYPGKPLHRGRVG